MDKKTKIQAAIDALNMSTPGDWWIDDRGDLFPDPVGTFVLGRGVGGGTKLWDASNRKVIEAARELAEEVVRLRGLVKEAHRNGFFDGTDGVLSLSESWYESALPGAVLEGSA